MQQRQQKAAKVRINPKKSKKKTRIGWSFIKFFRGVRVLVVDIISRNKIIKI